MFFFMYFALTRTKRQGFLQLRLYISVNNYTMFGFRREAIENENRRPVTNVGAGFTPAQI